MKIDELIKCINKTTTTVSAKNIGSEIVFYGPGKHSYAIDYFLSVPVDARVWDTIEFDPDNLDNVIPQDLARTMEIVHRLIDTPVRERFPEKEWYLCIGVNSKGHKVYLVRDYDAREIVTNINKDCMSLFTDRQVEELKKEFPKLAPAIDAMKEPVEDE